MKITPYGAAREVTGSCYLIETEKAKILVDCGLFQGYSLAFSKNFEPWAFDASTVDAVFITHAHLDHTGRLPFLCKSGFTGPVYLTPPTAKLAQLILEDAENIMEEDFQRTHAPKLYDRHDVDCCVDRFKPMSDESAICVKDLKITFHNAGHIFGSAFICLEDMKGHRAVFSGDLGNVDTPLVKPKHELCDADALFIESTYGNRIHEDQASRVQLLKKTIIETVKRNGVLLIPAFAVERTQELLYELNHLVENRLMPAVDIYLDSPMAIKASRIFDDYPDYYSRDAFKLIASGDELFDFPGLTLTMSKDESKAINQAPWPKVIIAGSGMMSGGRIMHHLVRYLGDPKTTLLIIGYQTEGTLGRKIYSGEKKVWVLNEMIEVKAQIVSIGSYSAHADQHMLIDWIKSADRPPKHIYCVHGEENAAAALATRIREELGLKADVPRFGQTIETENI